MKEIDMTPYEEYFTELERLYFEQNARMNIVSYMSTKNFTDEQHDRVYNDYLESFIKYEKFIPVFETKVVIPSCGGPVAWRADFSKRVIYINEL